MTTRACARCWKWACNCSGGDAQVLSAADGEAGLELFFQEGPDLVLLDVTMPRLSGFDVLKAIRRVSDTPPSSCLPHQALLDRVWGAAYDRPGILQGLHQPLVSGAPPAGWTGVHRDRARPRISIRAAARSAHARPSRQLTYAPAGSTNSRLSRTSSRRRHGARLSIWRARARVAASG
jgi:hypothetical protein